MYLKQKAWKYQLIKFILQKSNIKNLKTEHDHAVNSSNDLHEAQ